MAITLLYQFAVQEELSEVTQNVYYIFKVISVATLIASCVNFLLLLNRLIFTKNPKTKYDFINMYEITFILRSSLLLIISAAFIVNTLFENVQPLWIGVRAFVTVCIALIVGLSIYNILKFYYPFYIEQRLKKLRFTPRKSLKSGLKMELLSEEEEDAYLDEGMQVEENLFSVDYDVWYCKASGDVLIEKYIGHLHAGKCPSCEYQTFKIVKEEIVEKPSLERDGILLKHFTCSYCEYKATKEQSLKLSGSLNLRNKINDPHFISTEETTNTSS